MLKRGGIIWTIWNFVTAALFIALGVVMVAQSGNQDFRNVAFLIAGIFIAADATLRLATQVIVTFRGGNATVVKLDKTAALAGAAELAAGILLILVGNGQSAALNELLRYLAYFVGILLCVGAAVAIVFSSLYIVHKAQPLLLCVGAIILAAIAAAGGILIIVFATTNGEALLQILFVLFGLLFAAIGAAIAAIVIFVLVAAHQVKKAVDEVVTEDANPSLEGEVVAEVNPDEPKPEDKPE